MIFDLDKLIRTIRLVSLILQQSSFALGIDARSIIFILLIK
ncbi:hypothetical protein LEP1GSC029_1103 [Leptospira interrogans str. 2002000626]|uniref:Uncharacterized protein n=1 Tax=Leptospira interrogans str. 2002000626 TaxID=996803 RepID=A0A829D3E5_LEPIR|nr:hypothetical protein LEP1GSC029_1103 [Leptospira interrogans str. 2002000626]